MARREAHRESVRPWVEAHRQRAARGEKHPVYDFLFTYYSFRPAHLFRWSPGFGVLLENAEQADWQEFERIENGLVLRAERFPVHRILFLHWAVKYLETVQAREPSFGCFGLHEWAMVYQCDDIRHGQVPLRLSRNEIDGLVESQGLRCTHYDAFRFFTPAAVPRNRTQLTRLEAVEHDQPGCLHANMDLFKFAYAIAPFTSAEMIGAAFHFARAVREIDMRASPYDLSEFNFTPIRLETKAGREEYANIQKTLFETGRPLRDRLLGEYRALLESVTLA